MQNDQLDDHSANVPKEQSVSSRGATFVQAESAQWRSEVHCFLKEVRDEIQRIVESLESTSTDERMEQIKSHDNSHPVTDSEAVRKQPANEPSVAPPVNDETESSNRLQQLKQRLAMQLKESENEKQQFPPSDP